MAQAKLSGKEKRAKRHSLEHNMKCFAEKQVDCVTSEELDDLCYRCFYCVGKNGDQGALTEKWNQWVQGYVRYMRWIGITALEEGGNVLQLSWRQEPKFTRGENDLLTLEAVIAITAKDKNGE